MPGNDNSATESTDFISTQGDVVRLVLNLEGVSIPMPHTETPGGVGLCQLRPDICGVSPGEALCSHARQHQEHSVVGTGGLHAQIALASDVRGSR